MRLILKSLFSTSAAVIAIGFCIVANSCGPKIYSFGAKPFTKIVAGEAVSFEWKARGNTTLLMHEGAPKDSVNPGEHSINFKLVPQKEGIDFKELSLTVLPDTNIFRLSFNSVFRKGDSLIATEIVDTLTWGRHFIIAGITADSRNKRAFTVTHLDKRIELAENEGLSTGLNGLPNSGPWEIRTRLTSDEKRDTTLIKGKLVLKLILHHKSH